MKTNFILVYWTIACTTLGVAIASMTPIVSFLAIIHRSPAAQGKRSSTNRAEGLRGRSWVGDNLFSVCCASYFHGSPERFLKSGAEPVTCSLARFRAPAQRYHKLFLKYVSISLMDMP
jgi:hypothetical protein